MSKTTEEKTLKGNLKLEFITDGDFTFNVYKIRKCKTWKVKDDFEKYTFSLDFTGTLDELWGRIKRDIFANVSTSSIGVMQSLCDAFKRIKMNCRLEDMQRILYINLGNHEIYASFNFTCADRKDLLELSLEAAKEIYKSKKEDLDRVKKELAELEVQIESYKNELEQLQE